MKTLKRLRVALLCIVFLLCGCSGRCAQNETEQQGVSEGTPVPSTSAPETAEPTEAPTAPPTENPTPEPTEIPNETSAGEQDQRFLALDRELFVWYVSTDIETLDQYCEDPTVFGIDASTVPVTLGSLSKEDDDAWAEECKAWLERIKEIDRDRLSDTLAFAYDNYIRYFERQIEANRLFYCYEPLSLINGIHLNLPFTFALYRFRNEQDIINYFTLFNDVPRYMDDILAFEQERAARGLFMTEKMLDTILKDLQKVADSGDTSFLYGTFREEIGKADFLTEEQKEAYIAQNDALVGTVWVDSYQKLHDGLEQLRPQCRERKGAYAQGGDAFEYYCFTLLGAAGGYRSVEDELSLLQMVMTTIYNEFYYSAVNSYDELIKNEPITFGSIEEDVEYLKKLIPMILPPMPEVEVEYREVPKELQDSYSPAAYYHPSFDNYKHNTILINPQKECDLFTIVHEGYPGHMYQYTYHHALESIPYFLILIEPKGYAESWSTNAELNIARINVWFSADLSVATVLNKRLSSILAMIVSLKVNGQGASLSEIKKYCATWGMEDAAESYYNSAIDNPSYYFKYAGGFCELNRLTERMRSKSKKKLPEIYEEFLRWGPGYYDLLNERMNEWAKAN